MNPTREELARNRNEVIETVFRKNYRQAASEVPFTMDDVRQAIAQVARKRAGYKEKNVANVRYQYTSGFVPDLRNLSKSTTAPISERCHELLTTQRGMRAIYPRFPRLASLTI